MNYGNIASYNGLAPARRKAIIWTNAALLSIGNLGTNFAEIVIEIQTISLKENVWKYRLDNGGHFVSASVC